MLCYLVSPIRVKGWRRSSHEAKMALRSCRLVAALSSFGHARVLNHFTEFHLEPWHISITAKCRTARPGTGNLVELKDTRTTWVDG